MHDAHNVLVIFPNEAAEISTVVLVYDPLSTSASLIPDEKKKHLDDVEKEVLKMVKDAADVKSQSVTVEKRWHDAIVGHGGTTLNAYVSGRVGFVQCLHRHAELLVKIKPFRSRSEQKPVTPPRKILFLSVVQVQTSIGPSRKS